MNLEHLVRRFVCNTWVANKSNNFNCDGNKSKSKIQLGYECIILPFQLTQILRLVACIPHTNGHPCSMICFLVNTQMFQAHTFCALPLIYFMCEA